MKKSVFSLLFTAAVSSIFFFTACKKDKKTTTTEDFATVKTAVLADFVSVVANPLYADFKAKADVLKTAVDALAANTNDENLAKAQDAWRAIRVLWEQSEGFLIGPVDYDNLDPYMDTWPTDHNAMDDLLASATPLTVEYIAGLNDLEDEVELTLRGFHPLEYLLWGTAGNRVATELTDRQKEYMVALAADIQNNVTKLQTGWLPGGDNFGEELKSPGVAGSRYDSYKDALEALANALTEICAEVGEGKMYDPFVLPGDSTISESPYAHNSLVDFKNNIIGARNVYTCSFGGVTGKSLSDMIKYNNASLDLEIKQKFEVVINSFDGITTTFEQAIYTQRSQVQNTIDKIAELKASLEQMIPYINQYVKD